MQERAGVAQLASVLFARFAGEMLVSRIHFGLICSVAAVSGFAVAARAGGFNDVAHILPAPTLPTDPIVPPVTTFSLNVPAYSSFPSAAAKL